MNAWTDYKLKHITTKIGSGATPKGGSNVYGMEGIAFIRSQNVLDLKFSFDGLAFIDELQAERLDNVIVQKNDILINITGDSVARVCIVPPSVLPARVNQHVAIIRSEIDKVVPNFLLFYLQYFKGQLLNLSEIGGTRNALTKGMLEDLCISLPPLPEQQRIAEVLSSLDDKIELLHRQNKILEALAETLFRKTFFTEGGNSVTLGNYVNCINGYSYKSSELIPSNSALVTLKNFHRNGGFRLDGFKEFKGNNKNNQFVIEGDLIVAHTDITQDADVIGNPALVISNPKYDNLVITMDLVKVLPKVEWISTEFLYFLMKTKAFKFHCLGCSNGTTVLHLSKNAIPSFEFQEPSKGDVYEFTLMVKPLIKKIFINHKQIKTLTQLRDTLLPKLMSGAVRVSH